MQNTLSQELYYQSYSRIGVIFASITNYHEFYTELDGNNQGVECLRLLNEIIADFDDLLNEDRFKAIDKIKTVGSTYMAAVGLMPDQRILDDDETTAGIHLSSLVEFVFAMRDRLLNINENSYNNFMLRVGKFSKKFYNCINNISILSIMPIFLIMFWDGKKYDMFTEYMKFLQISNEIELWRHFRADTCIKLFLVQKRNIDNISWRFLKISIYLHA